MNRIVYFVGYLLCMLTSLVVKADDTTNPLCNEAIRSLKKAAVYYYEHVASHGGYAYYYSEDLQERWGEGKVSLDTILVQPPGTPTVGMAYLKAYKATGDKYFLAAAEHAAEALIAGQLSSGGWRQTIDFSEHAKSKARESRSSLDDGQTQSALQLLILVDEALKFENAKIHNAADSALNALLKAQFPNGAFPQVWTQPVASHPIVPAKLPTYDWKTEGRVKNYWDYYTLNDGLAGTVAETLMTAHKVYGTKNSKIALTKLGDFLLLAQMPDPQPGWCQQYNYEMFPMWARKFEPPAITGAESQDVMFTLIKIANHTGDKKYLAPIPRAIAYFKNCLLPDGKIARYYELGTNKPLYMDSNYQLTYDNAAAPSHYSWKQSAKFEAIEKAYNDAMNNMQRKPTNSVKKLQPEVRRIIDELDTHGRWLSTSHDEKLAGQPKFATGQRFLSSELFSKNITALSEFIDLSKP